MDEPINKTRKRRADSIRAEAEFRAKVAELGGTVIGEWVTKNTPVKVVCREGHENAPYPVNLAKNKGFCRTCAGQDPAVAEAAFRARVAELGGTVVGGYVGGNKPVAIVCPEGHPANAYPANVRRGIGMCRACAGQDPVVAEAAFRARVAELGGTVVGGYRNKDTPVEIRCAEGHTGHPYPGNVARGEGICGECVVRHDALYVVVNELTDTVKFGISSGYIRRRVSRHEAQGFTTTLRSFTGLPGTVARDTENAVRAALRMAGLKPLQGREYFAAESALSIVLAVVDAVLPGSA